MAHTLTRRPNAPPREWIKPGQVEKVAPVHEYLGLPADHITEADREGVDLMFYTAVMTK